MNILIALIPALGWGFMPIITGKVGGSPVNQMFGIGAGATIVGLISYLVTQPSVSAQAFGSLSCVVLYGLSDKSVSSFLSLVSEFLVQFHYQQFFS
jgi:Putative glucose uptake permease